MAEDTKKEHEEDKRVIRVLPRRVFKTPLLDFALGFGGIIMAACSAYLPYHVFVNSDQYGPPKWDFGDGNPLYEQAADDYEERRTRNWLALNQDVDTIVTGSVEKPKEPEPLQRTEAKTEDAEVRKVKTKRIIVAREPDPIPSTGRFRLVYVKNGRGLIQDGADMIPILAGSKLPDGTFVRSFKRKGGTWQMHTSDDRMFEVDAQG